MLRPLPRKLVLLKVGPRFLAVIRTVKGTNTNTGWWLTTAYSVVKNLEIEEGSFISEQNITSRSKVAVIGPSVRDDLFGENATGIIGQTIRIKQINFTVVGITKAKGGTGFGSQDDMIFVPLSTRIFTGRRVSTINVQAIDQSLMTDMQAQITSLLLSRHNILILLADFSTLNQADIIASASSITNTLTLPLGSIAGISLIVGGIVMNMMLTTVTERTSGLRKAIAGKVMILISVWSKLSLTFIGGFFGIIFGWLASLARPDLAALTLKLRPNQCFWLWCFWGYRYHFWLLSSSPGFQTKSHRCFTRE